MPGADRTGPKGRGPMTGRAAGYCSGSPVAGCMNPAPGRGFGSWGRGIRGRGGGRGWRNCVYATGWGFGPFAIYGDPASPATPREEEIMLLREQATYMNETLKEIKQRIQELDMQEREKE